MTIKFYTKCINVTINAIEGAAITAAFVVGVWVVNAVVAGVAGAVADNIMLSNDTLAWVAAVVGHAAGATAVVASLGCWVVETALMVIAKFALIFGAIAYAYASIVYVITGKVQNLIHNWRSFTANELHLKSIKIRIIAVKVAGYAALSLVALATVANVNAGSMSEAFKIIAISGIGVVVIVVIALVVAAIAYVVGTVTDNA